MTFTRERPLSILAYLHTHTDTHVHIRTHVCITWKRRKRDLQERCDSLSTLVLSFSPVAAQLRGHPSHVHDQQLPEFLQGRAVRKRPECTASGVADALQLDESRHDLSERAQIRIGKTNLPSHFRDVKEMEHGAEFKKRGKNRED